MVAGGQVRWKVWPTLGVTSVWMLQMKAVVLARIASKAGPIPAVKSSYDWSCQGTAIDRLLKSEFGSLWAP